jgi:hypothetical protein
MKSYFAKYFPVEGEIKEGDTTFYENKFKKVEMLGKTLVIWNGECHIQILKEKKYKLFLCSRDIQIGDTYYNESFEFTKYPNKSIAGSSTEWVGENGSYKVIGEISPEAIWVKENDEFEEEEIKRVPTLYPNSDWIEGSEKRGYESFFKIKGPCGHFH